MFIALTQEPRICGHMQADVVNRGFGGFYTPWFVDYMLDDLFDVKNPTLAILFLGVKDSLTQAVTGCVIQAVSLRGTSHSAVGSQQAATAAALCCTTEDQPRAH